MLQIEKINIIATWDWKNIMDKCTICYIELENDYDIGECGHRYHKECIKSWYNINKLCPNCKSEWKVVKTKDIIELSNETNCGSKAPKI